MYLRYPITGMMETISYTSAKYGGVEWSGPHILLKRTHGGAGVMGSGTQF